ncbi:MAG: hypothetical protein ACLGIN_18770 [Candidatus Sericytochromatia bacterium]
MKKPTQLLALAAALFAMYTPAAHAYIDPTAAGAALQSLYILLASAVAFVALLPHKVAGFFRAVKEKIRPSKAQLPAPDQDA